MVLTLNGLPRNGVLVGTGAKLRLSKSPMFPHTPGWSIWMRITWTPWTSEKLLLEMVTQVSQGPLLGTVISPVMSTPSISMWNVPPWPWLATTAWSVYETDLGTLIV